jgi:hypothetical protein
MALHHFLLLYNLREGRLERMEDFATDALRATDAYAALEREYRDRRDHEDYEIVLVGADSLDTVKVTHSRYFEERETVPF